MGGKRQKGEMSEIYDPVDIEARKFLWTFKDFARVIGGEISFVPPSLPNSIYRVPDKLRIAVEDAYQPRIISIGPYHHGKQGLQGSEKYKATYAHSLVCRGSDFILEKILNIIGEMEYQIRECYAERFPLDREEFIRMMVLDGCFILELLIKYQEEEANMLSKDFIFSTTWIVPSLRRDLVLLENQIPFFILEILYDLFNWPPQTPSLIQLVLDFFDPILPTISVTRRTHSIKTKHILDLLRSHLLLPPSQTKDLDDSPTSKNETFMAYFDLSQIMCFGDNPTWEYTASATDLQAAGVKFQKKQTAESLLDVTFTRDGKFEMPPFFFGESWTVLFPNLIALEQCRRDYGDRITSYVLLVNKLISSPSDVKLLRDKGIIDGFSRKEVKVVRVIGDLFDEVVVDKFYYDGLCNAVNAYCRRFWNRWRRTIMKSVLKTQLLAVSLVTVTLLVLIFISVR